MPKSSRRSDPIAAFVDRIADAIADAVAARVRTLSAGRGGGAGRPRRPLDMRCRVEGCKNRSRGPRFGFICDEHRSKLSKRDQAAARDAWNEKMKKEGKE
jgi:hypothetical protein